MAVTVIGYPLEPAESSSFDEPDEPYVNKAKAARAPKRLEPFRYCSVCKQLERVTKVVKKKMTTAHREDREEDARMLGRRLDILKEVWL